MIQTKKIKPEQKRNNCRNCGNKWHDRGREACPARNSICHSCKKQGHFAKVCISSTYHTNRSTHPRRQVRYTNDEPDSDSETTFRLESDKKNCTTPIAKINLSGIDINFIIDTGTSVNIINRSMYHKISHQPLERNSPNIYAYNSKEKLPVYGKFKGRF